jgi:LmbE family N-acetylglucosaminyl deacetylase
MAVATATPAALPPVALPAGAAASAGPAAHVAVTGTVVVLHAHPDDEAIFTGATLRALADRGVRVVVVTATSGEEGVPRARLAAGESLAQRRIVELERACELLGVARLVLLGYADSGAHAGPWRPGSLGAAPATEVAGRVAAIATQEGADALVHYDRRGIYGHVDHVQVHRAGALAAGGLGLTAYEATVVADRLRRGPRHVLQQAAGDDLDAGERPGAIDVTVRADPSALLAKMAAMTAHASQIGPQWLDHAGFESAYGREWFVRRGRPGLLDALVRELPGPSGRLVAR